MNPDDEIDVYEYIPSDEVRGRVIAILKAADQEGIAEEVQQWGTNDEGMAPTFALINALGMALEREIASKLIAASDDEILEKFTAIIQWYSLPATFSKEPYAKNLALAGATSILNLLEGKSVQLGDEPPLTLKKVGENSYP